MSQLTQALTNAASRNRTLLSVLTETDYAAKTLQQNTSYITDLEAQTKATEKELRKLHAITEDERKDHAKYRDSTFKRYAHKLSVSPTKTVSVTKARKHATRVHSVILINYMLVSSRVLHPNSPGKIRWRRPFSMLENISSKFSHSPMPTPLHSMLFAVPKHAYKLPPDP